MSFNLILHIGRHKSGTSALQIALHLNRELLDSQGILYPQAGSSGKTAHHDLAYSLNPRFKRNDYIELIELIAKEIRENHHTIIISSEAFQNIQVIDRVKLLVRTLKPERTQIICYFREYLDYCIASFCQRIQAQSSFITLKQLVSDMKNLSVEAFITRWRSIGDFKMFWFDRSKLHNMDIIDDFFGQVGLTSLVPSLEKYPSNPNPSIGGNLLFFKNASNFLGREFLAYQSMSKLAATFASFRTPMNLPSEQTDALRQNSSYNHYLFEQLGPIALKDWSNYPPVPNIDSLHSDIEKVRLFTPELGQGMLEELAKLATNDNDWFKIMQI